MACPKCGTKTGVQDMLCFKCFDEEILKMPGVGENYKLVKQEDGSFKPVAHYTGIKSKDVKSKFIGEPKQ